jgi:hypothetical protein
VSPANHAVRIGRCRTPETEARTGVVVISPLAGVRQHAVRKADALKYLHRQRVFAGFVRVVTQRQQLVGPLYVLGTRISWHACSRGERRALAC